MKKLFRKAVTVLGSAALVGASISGAAAATFPAPFDSGNYAVVYGSGSKDAAAANTIAAALPAMTSTTTAVVSDMSFTDSITDDEVELGTFLTAGDGADIDAILDDRDLAGLRDEKFSWDDGDGSDDYDIHEEIVIGDMKPLTTVDDEKLENGAVALTNERAMTYKLVFEDVINTSRVGTADADKLFLEILGQEYEVEAMTATSITVVTSEEVSLSIGGSYTTPGGKTVTLIDVYSGSVEVSVDGETEVISSDTTERVNGIRVYVDTVGYHSNTPETSRAVLKIGEDISKAYTSGEEFIGEDDADPLWIWDIANLGSVDGYIGVKYNADIDSANDDIAGDTIKYVGGAYVMPNNFAAVSLDALNNVDYQEVKFSFEDGVSLYAALDTSTAMVENVNVISVEAENTDSITINGEETDKMYIYWNTTSDSVQTFYRDHSGEYTPSGRMRLVNASVLSAAGTAETATIEIGETNLDIDIYASNITSGSGTVRLLVTNDQDSDNVVLNLSIAGTGITTSAGTFERFGTTAEDADALDIVFDGTDRSTSDYSYMDSYGVIISEGTTVEDEANDDEATLSVPEDQVYAQVTVGLGASSSGSDGGSTTGQKTFMDSESSSFSGKNIVVAGGSCINSVAASLLGGSHCGDAFTAATGVGAGKFLIQAFDRSGKTALLVAGYEMDDTAKAATYLANEASAVVTDVGTKYVGETATESAVKVS